MIIIPIIRDLPFEEGKTYKTKCQVPENFLVKKIIWNPQKTRVTGFQGIYEDLPHLGICPLNGDRLVAEKIQDGTEEVCGNCGSKI